MAYFNYKAIDGKGKSVNGTKHGLTKLDVIKELSKDNLTPVSVEEVKGKKIIFKKNKSIWRLEFTEYLLNLLKSNVELNRSLQILHESTEEIEYKDIIMNIINGLKSGRSFSDSLDQIKGNYFDELYVNLVKVGEESGHLSLVFEKLYDYLLEQHETKSYLISTMIYPIVLFVTGGLSTLILVMFVLPKFGKIFEELKQPVPFFTDILIKTGQFLNAHFFVIATVIAAVIFVLVYHFKSSGGKYSIKDYLYKMPVVGNIIFWYDMKKFFQTLGILLTGGTPILYSLYLCEKVVSLSIMRKSIQRIYKNIKQGRALSSLMKDEAIFPQNIISLVSIGEETGKMEKMLLDVADQLSLKIKKKIKNTLTLIEPVAIVLMGLFIGGIILSMLSSIFSINDVKF